MKKTLFFTTYCVVMLLLLVVIVLLLPTNNSKLETTLADSTIVPNVEDNDTYNNTPTIEENPIKVVEDTFVTSIRLNCIDEIILEVGDVARVKNVVTVEPESEYSRLTYELSSKNNKLTGITFDGEYILANEVGTYTITYRAPRSNNKYLEASITVKVVESKLNRVTQLSNMLALGETYKFSEIFNLNDERYVITCETDDKLLVVRDSIIATKSGLCNINIILNDGNIDYIYEFSMLVRDVPKYSLMVTAFDSTELDRYSDVIIINTCKGIHALSCYVFDENNEYVNQSINVEVEDEKMVNIMMVTEPIIVLDCVSSGVVEIVITSEYDTSLNKCVILNIL